MQVDGLGTAYLFFYDKQGSQSLGQDTGMPPTPNSDAYREKHRHYPVLVGRVAALEEEGVASTDPVSGEDSESEVEAVDGLNVCLAQAMSHYQREEWKCFMCGSPGHFTRDCPHHDTFKQWHWEQLNIKGVGENSQPTLRMMNQ